MERAIRFAYDVDGLSPRTIRWWHIAYRQLRRFLREQDALVRFLRGEPDEQARVLEEWIAWMRGRGLQHTSVRNYWCALVSLIDRFTVLHGVWNPLRQFRRPLATPPIPRAIPREDAERLLSHLSHQRGSPFLVARNLAFVGCMLFSGLRVGEVLALDVKDVHASARTFRIIRGKGKDGGKTRTAYMTMQLAHILRVYEEERENAGHAVADAYFLNKKGGARLGIGAVRHLFATIRARTGLQVSPHVLRHTYVTLLRQSGADDRVTMELAGHSSLAMTQRYSAVFSGEYLATADRLELDF
ncbi:MAG TPA: tyrosine-type recombinase/integrase [Thermoanaerobaculia bacterium]|nr:tyrosine-type recombinase/integrase [Thermoanaerobaculia bacterium]